MNRNLSVAMEEAWVDFEVKMGKTDGGTIPLTGKERARRKVKRNMATASRRKNR